MVQIVCALAPATVSSAWPEAGTAGDVPVDAISVGALDAVGSLQHPTLTGENAAITSPWQLARHTRGCFGSRQMIQ